VIETRGPVSAALFGDVDADGRLDLALLCDRQVQVHRLLPDDHLTVEPGVVVKLPEDAVAVDLKPLAKPGETRVFERARLVVATSRGLFTRDLSRADAPFEPLVLPEAGRSLVPLAAGAKPIAMPILDDLDGDGRPEAFLPTAEGIAVFDSTDTDWRLRGVAEADLAVKIESGEDRPGSLVRQSFELPRAALVDTGLTPAAAHRFLAITRGPDCLVYDAAGDGLRLFERARGLYRFDDEDRFREIRGTRRNDEVNDRSVGLTPVDLNADGIPDFVSSRFKDGQVFITYGREGAFAAGYPDKVLDVDGWVILAQTKDFDGDGLPDLVVPRIPKLGIAGAIKALLQRRIGLELWIFRNRGGAEVFTSSPDWKYTFDVEVQLGGEGGKFSATARMLVGFFDVNGDGLRDFVASRDDDKLSIHFGSREELIASTESEFLPIPPTAKEPEMDLRGRDVNGDKREDLLLLYGSNRRGATNKVVLKVWARD
jgi:uncharacterized protein YciU (UPF0263 family)